MSKVNLYFKDLNPATQRKILALYGNNPFGDNAIVTMQVDDFDRAVVDSVHGDKNIPCLQTDRTGDDLLPLDHTFFFRIITDLAVTDHDHHRVVILHDLRDLIADEVDDRKSAIGNIPLGTYRQR